MLWTSNCFDNVLFICFLHCSEEAGNGVAAEKFQLVDHLTSEDSGDSGMQSREKLKT